MKCKQPLLCSLFIFLLFVGGIIFIYISHSFSKEDLYWDSKINTVNNKILKLKRRNIKSNDFLKIAEDFEVNLRKKNIKTRSLKISNNKIILNVEAKLQFLITFVHFCEYYNLSSTIEQFSFHPTLQKDIFQSNIVIGFKESHIKSNKNSQNFQLKLMELKDKNNRKKKRFNGDVLYAIVGKFALINQIWVEHKKSYKEYILEEIDTTHIVLKKENKSIVLELFCHE